MGGSFLSGPSKPAGTKKKQNKKLFVGLKQELNIKHAREKRKKGGGRGESFSQRSRERQESASRSPETGKTTDERAADEQRTRLRAACQVPAGRLSRGDGATKAPAVAPNSRLG